jgi:hypothetical protein
MLAEWMASERRSFSLFDPLDFIVTLNKGIEPLDCWIFLPRDRTCCTLNYICNFLGSYYSLIGRT